MFKDQNQLNNNKLLNLANALENKDEVLNKLRIQLCTSILILSIICIVSIVCILIRPELVVSVLPITALIYSITSIILIKSRVIDIDHVVIIGVIYVLVYLCVSILLIGYPMRLLLISWIHDYIIRY